MEISALCVIGYGFPIVVLLIAYYMTKRSRTGIPGPWGLPFVGHLTFLGDSPHLTLTRWRKQYGDLYQIRMGSWSTVVISGKSLMKEALILRADDFSGRPAFYSGTQITGGKNITFGRFDSSWIKHRKIASGVLYSFANARKNPIEEIIHGEVEKLVKNFMTNGNVSFDPKEHLLYCSASVVYQICYGKAPDIEYDDDFKTLITTSRDFNEFVNAGNPVDMMPWLRFFYGRKTRKFLDVFERAERVRRKNVTAHMETFDSNKLRDVTDGLLAALDGIQEEEMKALDLTREQVMSTLDNFFGAGFDTIANTLHWSLLLLASFPDVQAKVFQEICDVTRCSRKPCLADKSNMPFTEATTAEILRYSCSFPMAIPHFTTRSTSVGGYDIPKSTVVLLNFYSVTHDPQVWGDPDNFRPERFLNEDGQLDKTILDRFIPFSSGRRRCVAEFLARIEIFLLLTGIVQSCELHLPDGVVKDLTPLFAMSLVPKQYKIIIKPRSYKETPQQENENENEK